MTQAPETMSADFTKLGRLTRDQKQDWDIIVVGSGHNGLTAAAYLAAAGKKVLVLERASYPGGGVASLPMTEPGFTSERHATIHQLLLGNPLIAKDELGLLSRFGLEYIPLVPAYAIIFEDGVLPIYTERAKTVEAISKLSASDASAWELFAERACSIVDLLIPSMYEPPTDMSNKIKESSVAELIDEASQSSTLQLVQKYFTDDTVKVAVLRFVTEVQLAHPTTKGTGLMAYLAVGMLERFGLYVPRGGGSGFTSAVVRCIQSHDGEVRLNTEVTKIVTEGGRAVGVRTRYGEIRAKECVVAQIHPHLLDRFVDGVDAQIISAAKATRNSEFTILAIHAALDEPLKFNAGGVADTTVMNTVCPNNLEELIKSYDEMAKGRLPENIMIGASCVNHVDPTRVPVGKSLLHAVVMVRAEPEGGDLRKWEEIKDSYVQKIFKYLTRFTSNLTPNIIRSYHVVTPANHQEDTPSFQNGDISGLSMGSDQMGAMRPTPALAQYRVPGVKDLYLAGPFMHPGGGVWGGGRPVAKRIFEDKGIEFEKVIRDTKAGARVGSSRL